MRKNYTNKINDPVDLIDKMKPQKATRSKEDVWAELELMMEQPIPSKIVKFDFQKWQIAASIAFLVILGATTFARFYTKSIVCENGKRLSVTLPDGSKADLNAGSTISYQPLWWKLNKEIFLDGEAFFSGEHARNFTVKSKNATITVLGTSFNVLTRGDDFAATCVTGKIKVTPTFNDVDQIVAANHQVTLNSSKKSAKLGAVNAASALDWKENQFIFTQTKLTSVLEEIARRYNVEIISSALTDSQIYTGSFQEFSDVASTLDIVCKPFDLDYQKLPSGGYEIKTRD